MYDEIKDVESPRTRSEITCQTTYQYVLDTWSQTITVLAGWHRHDGQYLELYDRQNRLIATFNHVNNFTRTELNIPHMTI